MEAGPIGAVGELLDIWRAGVAAVDGTSCVKAWFADRSFRPTSIAAVGKAAPMMAAGALAAGCRDMPGVVISKHRHFEGVDLDPAWRTLEASHPVPDETSLEAGKALMDFVENCPPESNLLVLVSGGASALAEVLVEPHTLRDLAALNEELLSHAHDITEINRRRREWSAIKGGGLLDKAKAGAVRVLAISDVPGDDIAVIGSGIGDIGRCSAPDCEVYIVGSNSIARRQAGARARQAGHRIIYNEENMHGELSEVADRLAQMLVDGPPGIYIFGGEPFLELPAEPGEGGRNQALALEIARRIDGHDNIAFLSAGTDGGDGPGPAAGGFVTGATWGTTPGGDAARAAADSGNWLRAANGLVVTGPTGTNVMDIAIGLKA